MAKAEFLHKVTMATVDHLQIRNTILRNSKAMEVYIGRPRTLEVCKIKVINLRLIKTSKEGCSLIHKVRKCGRIVAHLKLRRGKWEVDLSRKHEVWCELRRTNSQ